MRCNCAEVKVRTGTFFSGTFASAAEDFAFVELPELFAFVELDLDDAVFVASAFVGLNFASEVLEGLVVFAELLAAVFATVFAELLAATFAALFGAALAVVLGWGVSFDDLSAFALLALETGEDLVAVAFFTPVDFVFAGLLPTDDLVLLGAAVDLDLVFVDFEAGMLGLPLVFWAEAFWPLGVFVFVLAFVRLFMIWRSCLHGSNFLRTPT